MPLLTLDKHKVLQILINFIRNAKYALDECTPNEKRLVITVAKTDGDCVMVRVEDNGIGIPPENLTRIPPMVLPRARTAMVLACTSARLTPGKWAARSPSPAKARDAAQPSP